MMRYLIFLLCLVFLSTCAGQSALAPPKLRSSAHSGISFADIGHVFPQGQWEFVHDIRFAMAGKGGGVVLGVLAIDDRSVSCALMTVEGFTLFEGRSVDNGPVEVSRALPPFDRDGFAAGLLDDIRLMFRAPPGDAQKGLLADGTKLIRYKAKGAVTDIVKISDGCWAINSYHHGIKDRSVLAKNCRTIESTPIPDDIKLENYGQVGYSLYLHLLSGERIATNN